ncbi:hypothetical protein BGW37DRAFT_501153 [Umbelopsis sp. PMI_123]|nr:hypothetical protein BGW37DRAFT_501153 [Umbelopsis sp. PMI_123]
MKDQPLITADSSFYHYNYTLIFIIPFSSLRKDQFSSLIFSSYLPTYFPLLSSVRNQMIWKRSFYSLHVCTLAVNLIKHTYFFWI